MIIGIVGSLGAGKGTVVEYLEQKGFKHISARKIWTEELVKRGIEINRDTMTKLANDLRAENGADYFVRLAMSSVTGKEDVVIESIRTVAEADLIKSEGGVLLAVDAEQKLRYERVSQRGSDLDKVSFAEFVRQEEVEAQNKDLNKQNISKVIKEADFVIDNNGSLESLHAQIEEIFKNLELL